MTDGQLIAAFVVLVVVGLTLAWVALQPPAKED